MSEAGQAGTRVKRASVAFTVMVMVAQAELRSTVRASREVAYDEPEDLQRLAAIARAQHALTPPGRRPAPGAVKPADAAMPAIHGETNNGTVVDLDTLPGAHWQLDRVLTSPRTGMSDREMENLEMENLTVLV